MSKLHFPAAQQLTHQYRKDLKQEVAETPEEISGRFMGAKGVAKFVSKIDFDKADKATVDRATKWGDSIARPLNVTSQYGAVVSNGLDRLLSLFVGRGLKEDAPADFHKLGEEGVAVKALRQEGLLGFASRGTALGLGCLVGACYRKSPEKAQAAREAFDNAGVGFNAAVRVATLTLPTFLCTGLGVVVGAGLSALTALVAVPVLWRMRESDGAAAPAAAKPNENEAARPQDGVKAGIKVDTKADKKLASTHKAALAALQALAKKAAPKADKTGEQLAQAADDAKTAWSELTDEDKAGPRGTQAWQTYQIAKAAVDAHDDAGAQGERLAQGVTDAKAKLAEAAASGDDTQIQAAYKAMGEAQKALESHRAKHGAADAAPAPKAQPLSANARRVLQSYQEQVIKHATASARARIDGKDGKNVQEGYAEVTTLLHKLRTDGVIEDSETMPLDAHLESDWKTSLEAAQGHRESLGTRLMAVVDRADAAQRAVRTQRDGKQAEVDKHLGEAAEHFEQAGAAASPEAGDKLRDLGKEAQKSAMGAAREVEAFNAELAGVVEHEYRKISPTNWSEIRAAHQALGDSIASVTGPAEAFNLSGEAVTQAKALAKDYGDIKVLLERFAP